MTALDLDTTVAVDAIVGSCLALTLLVGQQEGHLACRKLSGKTRISGLECIKIHSVDPCGAHNVPPRLPSWLGRGHPPLFYPLDAFSVSAIGLVILFCRYWHVC